MSVKTVGVVFGGLSPEHEVSVITSLQAAAAMDRAKYHPVPVYIAKDGVWYTGEGLLDIEGYSDLNSLVAAAARIEVLPGGSGRLRVGEVKRGALFSSGRREWTFDVMFLGLHGGAGENGGMQGFCELMGVPYTGSGILGSALAMDKIRSKDFCGRKGIPVVESMQIREQTWAGDEERWLDRICSWASFPLIVKPVGLGSSIGIRRTEDRDQLDGAIEEAFRYDPAILVERVVSPLREINAAVLGDEDHARASVLEEPISGIEMLSFQDKYIRGGEGSKGVTPASKDPGSAGGMASQNRLIPAPLTEDQTEYIQKLAVRIFQILGCAGVARIDFLMNADTGDVFFNEINTIPGSLSCYLWEPADLAFQDLVHELIEIALRRYHDTADRVRSYDVNLLEEHSARGLKV